VTFSMFELNISVPVFASVWGQTYLIDILLLKNIFKERLFVAKKIFDQ